MAPKAGTIAGLTVRRGAEAALSESTTRQLNAFLHDPAGFDDDVLKRCVMGELVGFKVMFRSAGGAEAPAEIVIDLGCHKIFAVTGDRAPRTVYASHFDPSRARGLALAKELFPKDPQLAALKP